MTRFSSFITGTLFGAVCVAIVAALNWPAPEVVTVIRYRQAPVPAAVVTPSVVAAVAPIASASTIATPASTTVADIALPPSIEPVPLASLPASAGTTAPALSSPSAPLVIPVAGAKAGELSDTFKDARSEGRVHDAIDIMAPRGTPVIAADNGKVVKLFNSKPGGLTVYQFDPSETYAYYYAHLDSYAPGLVEGRQLRRGDLIGYVGSTGNASPDAPHLHFAIFVLGPEKRWWQGTAINPYPILSAVH